MAARKRRPSSLPRAVDFHNVRRQQSL